MSQSTQANPARIRTATAPCPNNCPGCHCRPAESAPAAQHPLQDALQDALQATAQDPREENLTNALKAGLSRLVSEARPREGFGFVALSDLAVSR